MRVILYTVESRNLGTRLPGSPDNSATPWQGEKNPHADPFKVPYFHFPVVKALCLHKVPTFPLFKGIWVVYSLLYSQANNTYKYIMYFWGNTLTYSFLTPFPITRHFHKLGHPSFHIRPSFRDSYLHEMEKSKKVLLKKKINKNQWYSTLVQIKKNNGHIFISSWERKNVEKKEKVLIFFF